MFSNDSQQLISNKIMILYVIQAHGHTILQSDLTEFFMTYDYMNFFEFQQYLTELHESQLLQSIESKNGLQVHLTESGLNSLKFFSERLERSLRKEIDLRTEIGKTKKVVVRKPEGRHLIQDHKDFAELILKEGDSLLFYLKLMVHDRQAAEVLISRWYDDYEVMSKELKNWYGDTSLT